ncbi:ADR330Wp [Eremothecium gossypii ATCC 10895]|uniref:ADR330Wp n=1 Tax=Eremothecium gossypii (strain ATCC 10895 / CBS 109.51 / FGSC 9923 / NRRL Y-1056) TaxID=284811 RepID=Q759E7_EREGS|nr:ADR330Wp [Eremothecium gossypii ATCC 10895]AAS52250.1 ADR330Wp [Eremothecium gossypii ATCC 10895]AEY96549.1 FADR330Wp [Eremothecium gossypii FDAG1]
MGMMEVDRSNTGPLRKANNEEFEIEIGSDEDVAEPGLDHPMERRIVRKMDLCLLPLMCILYFLSNLDKSNIGNAAIAGMTEDLKLVGNQYGNCVTVFFATYITFDPIGANLMNIVGAPVMMTGCIIGFGLISLCTAWVKNYWQLLLIRILLGAFEGNIYPAINMYLSVCYRREQYAIRFAWVFFAACVSSSFGGLISYGCAHIKGSLNAWQYIYIVEGALTLAVVPFYWFGLSKNLQDSWFFNKEEREYIIRRYETMYTYNPNERFEWRQLWLAVRDVKTWISAISLFCIDLTTFGLTIFMPIIISGMGFTHIRAQLMTVPVYFFTAITFFICAYLSDKLRLRSPFIVGACVTCAIGLAIVLGSHSNAVKFFGIFVLALGIYVNASTNCLWLSGNVSNYYKRATALGINLFSGSSSGLVAGQIFTEAEKPGYKTGLTLCMSLQIAAIFLTLLQLFCYYRLNKKKKAMLAQSDKEELKFDRSLGDENPHFLYMY